MAEKFALQKAAGSLMATDPAAVAAAEAVKARIQAGYLMALQKERDEDEARARILKACKRVEFAKDVEFSIPRGGTTVNGFTIRFAEVALKEWGNVLTETQTLYEDDLVRRVKVFVTDLETNITHSREPQISKTVERKSDKGRDVLAERTNSNGDTVYIVRATDEELMTKENSIISRIIRNEGLRLIPNDIKVEAVRIARATIRNSDSVDPDGAKKQIVDAFAELNVMPKDLAEYLGHGLGTISPTELESLRGIYKAIKDGEASWIDYAGHAEDEPGGDDKSTNDFDAEFKDVSGSKEWSDFWGGAVAHYREQSRGEMGERELKTNVMLQGPEKLRAEFNKYLESTKAKDAKAKPTKKATRKKTQSKTSAAAKKKALEALHQSDTFQEYQLYKAENSDITAEESGGKEPQTIDECQELCDRIQARLDAIDGAADGMPG